jgi:DivIVA domain-containing protein
VLDRGEPAGPTPSRTGKRLLPWQHRPVVTVLGLLAVLAVLFAAAVVATRDDPLLAEAPPDRPDLELPAGPLTAADVEAVRFPLALRGYRMDEVDAVLARLAEELAERDRRLAAGAAEPPAAAQPEPGGGRDAGPAR